MLEIPLERWGSEIDLDLLQLKDMQQEPEKIVREAYAELLRSLAYKVTAKNEQGDYLYGVPATIAASTITSNLDAKLCLSCICGHWGE